MMGFGFAEILILAMLSGGMTTTDVVAMVQPTHYFKSRNVEPTIDAMIDTIIVAPDTPKAQIRQLVALRHLADEADKFKKDKNYASNREAVEEVADGKRGKDPQGFAQEYARQLLAKLDGKKHMPEKVRPLREDALSWFPDDVKLGVAFDVRPVETKGNDAVKDLLKMLPDQAKAAMYDQLEQVGNIRMERIAVGFVDADKEGERKFYVRFSGKANPAWIAPAIQRLSFGQMEAKTFKAADGTPIVTLREANSEPMMALVGDSDLLIVGYDQFGANPNDLVTQVLEIRAKKKPSASAGALKDRLAKIPDKATAFFVGELPKESKHAFGNFEPLPSKIAAYLERTNTGLSLKAESVMANKDEADKLVGKIGELRKQGIEGLKQAMKEPLPPGSPPVPFQALIGVMESFQVQSKTEKVEVSAFVTDGLIRELGQAAVFLGGGKTVTKDFDFKDKK